MTPLLDFQHEPRKMMLATYHTLFDLYLKAIKDGNWSDRNNIKKMLRKMDEELTAPIHKEIENMNKAKAFVKEHNHNQSQKQNDNSHQNNQAGN